MYETTLVNGKCESTFQPEGKGRASGLLKDAGMKAQSEEMFRRVTACDDYNKALNIISEYVDTELSGHTQPKKSHQKKGHDAHER